MLSYGMTIQWAHNYILCLGKKTPSGITLFIYKTLYLWKPTSTTYGKKNVFAES